MNIKSLSLLNYRNFESLELDFSEKINCFIGLNGVGKTNILDSIYYLSFCKSWLNPIDNQNIRYTSDFFMIKANYQFNDTNEVISCGFKKGKKKSFKRNNKEYKRLSEHIGLIPLVSISPYDSNLILGGSEERRKFTDIIISQFDKKYLDALLKYNRTLLQRNYLLKQFANNGKIDAENIAVWNEQLSEFAKIIFEKRKDYVKNITPIFQKYYNYISKENEKVELIYKSHLTDNDYISLLEFSFEKDRILQYTSIGVHRDDLIFQLNEHPLKKNASQGQQKSYLIALKLAQFDYIQNISNIKPILLFDDIFDKLDALRVKQIIKLVGENNFGQIFITDTNQKRLDEILNEIKINYSLFKINNKIESFSKDFN